MSAELNALPDGWIYTKLADCTVNGSITYGIVQPGQQDDLGVPIIRVNNFNNCRLDVSEVMRVSSGIESKYKRTRLTGGEVLLTLVGSAGQSLVVPATLAGWNVARAIGVINVKPEIGPEWINICLQSKQCQHYLHVRANTTVQKTLNLKDVKDVPIPVPPLKTRKQIESMICSLDDKIELNRQINQTLEQMAQAIFKSWFVDFDPVHAKVQAIKDGRDPIEAAAKVIGNPALEQVGASLREIDALFPSEFEESELGLVPKGWGVVPLGKEVDFSTGFAFKSAEFTDAGIKLARGDNVKEGFFHWGDKARYWPEITGDLQRYLLKAGDVLLGMDGSKVGKNWVKVRSSDLPCLLVQRVARLRGNGSIGSGMLEILMGSDRFKGYVESVKTGTSIPHISGNQIKNFPIVNPNDGDRIFLAFESVVSSLTAFMDKNIGENKILSELRDTLLPKLLSGEIRVGEVEQQIAEVV